MDTTDFLIYLVFSVLGLMFLALPFRAAARFGLLRKAGMAGWKGLVPFYGEYLQYRLTWKTEWYWFHLLSLGGRFVGYVYFAQAVLERATSYSHAELMGMLLLSLPDVVLALAGLCVRYVAMERLAAAFGRSLDFAMGLFLLNPVFMMILGFGEGSYRADRTAKPSGSE